MWQIKRFADLTAEELYRIMYLRVATFVVDQKRIYQEVDNKDPRAIHLFYVDQAGQIEAYARVFLIDHGHKVFFGRVVTSKKIRGTGFGAKLLNKIMATIKREYPHKEIVIDSQVQVKGFYQKAGFVCQGQPFIYKSTPHIKMTHKPLS